ncbi:olfactory receptor 10A3-like [Bufo gargarizans]|uniref:olfactory receptor 10A3-like n=1 Tax=Bufo gargarizans TaxID=30331 RepID=UPI001CF322BB|nr:olfactory receptor 10A3-like [Bufo gargarizans]
MAALATQLEAIAQLAQAKLQQQESGLSVSLAPSPVEPKKTYKTPMDKENQSSVTELLLLGFPNVTGYKAVAFFIFILIVYILTLMTNIMVIVLVSIKPQLHSPMYFFLQQFSLVESILLTVIVPKMLHVVWLEGATISIIGCITQTYIYCAIGCTECHLLTVMAYDRYLAICNPLRYNVIMDLRLQHHMVVYCWVFGFLLTQITLALLCQLEFCGPPVIDHFFCDAIPFVDLSCSYKFALKLEIMIISVPIIVIPFILVIMSYTCVCLAIFGISSATGRKKTFSTCSSHLAVVTMFYGTLITIYTVPANGYTLPINKFISFLYIVVTPLFNPIIYCLRNQEMRVIMERIFRRRHKK